MKQQHHPQDAVGDDVVPAAGPRSGSGLNKFLRAVLASLMVVAAAAVVSVSNMPAAHANAISTLVTTRASGSVGAVFTLTAGEYIVSYGVRPARCSCRVG
jgi:hypothetical protein